MNDKTCHVRLTPYENGYGIKTELDGFEVPEVSKIRFVSDPGDIATLTLSVNINTPFEIDLPAAVTVKIETPYLLQEARRALTFLIENRPPDQNRTLAERVIADITHVLALSS
jgi:hypothetical protein